MGKTAANLLVIAGPETGREFVVPESGARLGRSSSNDIALKDPAMSRFHCRFFYKPGEGLWAEDLGSANQTLLNRQPLHVARLQVGDVLSLGDTEIKVLNDQPPAPVPQNLFAAPTTTLSAPADRGAPSRARHLLRLLAAAAGGIILAALVGVVYLRRPQPPPQTGAETVEAVLQIEYEKVQASPQNVFRYVLSLARGELSVQIDDLANNRHVAGNQRKKLPRETLEQLAEEIQNAGFFDLQPSYKGLATNVWDQWDLTAVVGRRAARVKVTNTLGPESFRHLCGRLEELAQGELGLAALALTPEKLRDLAQAAFLSARTFYDQRMVKNENLAQAIRSLQEAEWYLETIEPKPDYYAEIVALRGSAERELDEIVRNHEFLADRAVQLKDWAEAAAQLRAICERVPDRADERHARARRRLLDVERNLKQKK